MIGSALAATIIDGVATGFRRVERGRIARSWLARDLERLTTPDGATLSTASGPSGELVAAWRASGAASVVAASSYAPTALAVRAILPALSALLRLPPIRRLATGRLARVPVRAQERPREFSWAHARVEWATGATREGWLRAGDGMDFTAAAAADVAGRLARGEGKPGAYTPGALFGPSLATDAGGQFILDHDAPYAFEQHLSSGAQAAQRRPAHERQPATSTTPSVPKRKDAPGCQRIQLHG